LIKYSIKTWQGLGRKVRLRRKHRRDVVSYTPLLAFRKAQRGREKIRIEEIIEHPRPSQEEIRALGLQAIGLSFRAPEINEHVAYACSLGFNKLGDDPKFLT
jgi:hypothetical protein